MKSSNLKILKKIFLIIIFLKMISIKSILLFILLFLMLNQNCSSQSGWVSQSSGTTEHLRSVCFVNDLTGWTVGFSGKIAFVTGVGT